ncbi:hypothetical protein OK016_09130 [Vibrio chagasii]|nr:hypothetical protein [Vibrio chagasii]
MRHSHQFSSDLDEATKKQLDHGQKSYRANEAEAIRSVMLYFDQALVIFAARAWLPSRRRAC